jgi:hypothetical protein
VLLIQQQQDLPLHLPLHLPPPPPLLGFQQYLQGYYLHNHNHYRVYYHPQHLLPEYHQLNQRQRQYPMMSQHLGH